MNGDRGQVVLTFSSNSHAKVATSGEESVNSGVAPVISGKTNVYFHIGDPIEHAKAPGMFNAEFSDQSTDSVLIPIQIAKDALSDSFDTFAGVPNLRGLLVTMPHKVAIADLVDVLGQEAHSVGAANAVRFDRSRRSTAEMFDGLGLVAALSADNVEVTGSDVFLFGCGGAGSAIAFAVARAGIGSLTLANRNRIKSRQLAARLSERFPEMKITIDIAPDDDHQIVINASSLGMQADDPAPIQLSQNSTCVVVDIVTGVAHSKLLREADGRGLRTVTGRDMLLGQVKEILAFWGHDDPPETPLDVPSATLDSRPRS